jgi:hypothetical protein
MYVGDRFAYMHISCRRLIQGLRSQLTFLGCMPWFLIYQNCTSSHDLDSTSVAHVKPITSLLDHAIDIRAHPFMTDIYVGRSDGTYRLDAHHAIQCVWTISSKDGSDPHCTKSRHMPQHHTAGSLIAKNPSYSSFRDWSNKHCFNWLTEIFLINLIAIHNAHTCPSFTNLPLPQPACSSTGNTSTSDHSQLFAASFFLSLSAAHSLHGSLCDFQ